jgi:hypothetical protein
MKPKVYLETTIISYLTAWRSHELVMAANQETTKEWWDEHRKQYNLFISELVMQEASAGDKDAARRRIKILKNIAELEMKGSAQELAKGLIKHVPLPLKAQVDALHIALATIHGMDYLLTWNCKHIANAIFRHKIEEICRNHGYEAPVICTPLELLEAGYE